MFFSNDTRVANTATPNNFVVGASDPNVGQYGWTKADVGHYNQLIQYVEECRESVNRIEELADYIGGVVIKVEGINTIYEDVVRIQTALREVEALIEADTTYFKREYANFLEKIEDFDKKYQDFLSKYQETIEAALAAKASADAAKLSETNAKVSEESAAQSAKEAAEVVARGLIYRGVWNASTKVWPDHKGTNSMWDVTVDNTDEDTGVDFEGKKWYAGDRLIYVIDTGSWEQIVSGSSVKSVNGKTGAVTITATEIGALPVDGNAVSASKLKTPRSIAGKPFDGTQDVPIKPLDIGAVDSGRTINGKPLTSDIALDYSDVGAVPPTRKVNNKPLSGDIELTATDVGAWPANQVHQGGNTWADIINKVPRVNGVGVTELGAYLDMKEEKSDADFNWRWWAGVSGAGKLTLQNGASTAVAEFGGDGKLHLPASGITCQNRIDVRAGQNPMLELHAVGKHAYAQYVTDGGDWRFVRTDGAGGEATYQFVSFNNGDLIVRGKYRVDNHGNCGWNTPEYGAFRVNAVINMTPEALTKVFSHRVEYPGHWTLDQSYGTYSEVSGSASEISHTFVSTDGGSFYKIWKLRNDGVLNSPGSWHMAADGNLFGNIWGGYISGWIQANFAPISDSRLKRNIQESTKSALDDVAQIKFHSYEWVDDGITKDRKPTELGILAQEMEAINPAYTKDIETFKEDGSVATSLKSLDVTNMLALALKANQELMEELKVVKNRLSVLESK